MILKSSYNNILETQYKMSINKKLTSINDIRRKIDRDKRLIMNELKKNFNFIEGANEENSWRFERNL